MLNPVAYLNGLAKAITDKGGKIFEQTRVRKPDSRVLETEGGNKVSSSACAVCSSAVQSHAVTCRKCSHMQKLQSHEKERKDYVFLCFFKQSPGDMLNFPMSPVCRPCRPDEMFISRQDCFNTACTYPSI